MHSLSTESVHDHALGLDARPEAEILNLLLGGQLAALKAVAPAISAISQGAALIETALRGEGRLYYVGAGSSALMANADGLELAGTFGTDPSRVVLCMAGGLPQDSEMPGGTEDNTGLADDDAASIEYDDVVIAVTASGRTPYALRFAEIAKRSGAKTICIANNPDAPIFTNADVAICLPTPPELVAGSTRMGAGTAQKAALNMMSTLAAIRLGHIYDGMMVNLRADNDKLRRRATAMVMQISGNSREDAESALVESGWKVKTASIVLSGAGSVGEAEETLNKTGGRMRAALTLLNGRAKAAV